MTARKTVVRGDVRVGAIEEARERFEQWRSSRARLSPIPEALWAAAVGIAKKHGLSQTCQALRLNYYELKRHVESAAGNVCAAGAKTTFVELITPRAAAGVCECLVELENSGGAKMRIHLKGTDTPDLVGLCSAFWNGRS
jgi:hypothetical protein